LRFVIIPAIQSAIIAKRPTKKDKELHIPSNRFSGAEFNSSNGPFTKVEKPS